MKKFLILAIMVLTLLVPTAVMGAPFEGSGTIVTTTVVVPQTVVFSILNASESDYLTTLDFGTVIAGRDSAVQEFSIRNDGTGSITVKINTAHLFYQQRMKVSFGVGEYIPYSVMGYWASPTINGSLTIPPGGTQKVYAKVTPASADTGTQPGVLTFVATLVPVP